MIVSRSLNHPSPNGGQPTRQNSCCSPEKPACVSFVRLDTQNEGFSFWGPFKVPSKSVSRPKKTQHAKEGVLHLKGGVNKVFGRTGQSVGLYLGF